MIDKNTSEEKALLSVKEMCIYLSIGQTKRRELLSDPANGFTVRIGNRLYAHKKHLDKWLERKWNMGKSLTGKVKITVEIHQGRIPKRHKETATLETWH